MLSASAVVYLYAYQKCGARPGANALYPQGWWGWWDQSQYLKCTASLARGSLTPDTYWYPLGYSALGAPFYSLMPDHAFLIPNLLLVAGIATLFFEIAKRLVTPVEAVLLMAGFTFCYRGLLSDTLVVPWNTIPTHFLAYAVIVLVAFVPVTRKRFLLSALCVGLMYVCRPAEAFCMGLLVGIALLRLPSWSERFRTGLFCLAIFGCFWGFVLLVNYGVFASWLTPYEKAVKSIGFGGYPVLQKVFWLIVDSRPVCIEPGTSLSSHFPWLLLVIPGAVYFVRRYSLGAVGILLSIGVTYVLYFQFNDFWPGNLFKYLVVHYLVWTFPILALLAYLAVREAWKFPLGRWSFGLMLLLGVTMWLLTIREEVDGRVAGPPPAIGELTASVAQPIDWVFFRGLQDTPQLENRHRKLRPMIDFVYPGRLDGALVVLSKETRTESVKFDTSGMPGFQAVEYGRFIWRFQSVAKALQRVRELFAAGPRVVSVAKVSDIDIAGPSGGPDGQPDRVIELELSELALKQIRVWDLATDNNSGHWTSVPNNPQGWWVIKTLPSTGKPPARRGGIRLCFPDVGQFGAAPSLTLRGLDDFGLIHAEVTIRPSQFNSNP